MTALADPPGLPAEPYPGHDAAYQAGYDAAMAQLGVADCWTPVPTRWRHVQPGDVIVGPDGKAWAIRVCRIRPRDGRINVVAVRALAVLERPNATEPALDPDGEVMVLEPVPMDMAGRLAREQLGAMVLQRRITQEES